MSTLDTLKKKLPRGVRVRFERGVYELIGLGAPVFLGVNKTQAAGMLSKILKLSRARENPTKSRKRTGTRAKAKPAARRNPRKAASKRRAAVKPSRKPAKPRRKRAVRSGAAKRNPSDLFVFIFENAGGKDVGRAEWSTDVAGSFRHAAEGLALPKMKAAQAKRAKIYLGPRHIGTVDRDGEVWMNSRAIGVLPLR